MAGSAFGNKGRQPASNGSTEAPESASLTEREIEVLRLVASGYSTKEVSSNLCISTKTVEAHRSRIMWKLNVHGVVELVHYAIKTGIVKV
jgi:two-component system, NarL family, response regulator NreC